MNSSELILNSDGTIFHLHLTEEMIADDIILVGDPARSEMISSYFDTIESSAANREFKTFTGTYHGKRLSVLSTGIGVGNIDIVVNELAILASRSGRHLNLIRLGTCGAVSPDLMIGDYVASEYSIGTDGLAFYYKDSIKVRCSDLEDKFSSSTQWPVSVYAVRNDERLLSLFDGFAKRCITVSAVGFYAPQGRNVLLEPWSQNVVSSLENVKYKGLSVGNFEMEGAPIALLSGMAGLSSVTVAAVIAQRVAGKGNPDYGSIVRKLVEYTLKKLAN